ncbi:MAG: SGNH/GDSL hydrolase family protein [Cryobacterium sp.]|nr:SGNH/GDSL hydrolase family protein [Cryobacterium sp.]
MEVTMRAMVKALVAAAGFVAVGLAGIVVLMFAESLWARQRRMPEPVSPVEVRSGIFGGDAGGEPLELAILGDSLAVGYGADDPDCAVGVLLAEGLAAASGRPVQLRNVAVVGAESRDLADQIPRLCHPGVHLEVVVIIVGGNEILHLHRIGSSVQYLAEAVRFLRRRGCEVVVATCPDVGTVRIFAQPLRFLAHVLSRLLATAQTIVVLRAGGRTVSMADELGPLFRTNPDNMFSADQVHPSSLGYARAAATILPSVCAAAGYWTGQKRNIPHRIYRPDLRIHRLAWLAFRTVRHAGAEVRPAGAES